jgi:hypothetical protein
MAQRAADSRDPERSKKGRSGENATLPVIYHYRQCTIIKKCQNNAIYSVERAFLKNMYTVAICVYVLIPYNTKKYTHNVYASLSCIYFLGGFYFKILLKKMAYFMPKSIEYYINLQKYGINYAKK